MFYVRCNRPNVTSVKIVSKSTCLLEGYAYNLGSQSTVISVNCSYYKKRHKRLAYLLFTPRCQLIGRPTATLMTSHPVHLCHSSISQVPIIRPRKVDLALKMVCDQPYRNIYIELYHVTTQLHQIFHPSISLFESFIVPYVLLYVGSLQYFEHKCRLKTRIDAATESVNDYKSRKLLN